MALTLTCEQMVERERRLESRAEDAEALLVRRAQKGDEDAFGELVLTYQERLFNFVLARIRQRELAEDIAQEVLVKAFFHLKRLRKAERFKSWLFSIAHNHLRDLLRKRRLQQVDMEESHLEVYVDDRGPEGIETTRSRQQVVQDALAQLKPEQREVLILYDLEGLSYKEIAEILRVPLGTVQSRIFYARRRIKDVLVRQFGFEGSNL